MPNWRPEPQPVPYDDVKKAFFSSLQPGVVRVNPAGSYLPGTWWKLEESGATLGYGWMDVTWGDAQILLAVAPDARRGGHGKTILQKLEHEAHEAGLAYMFNTIPSDHPDPDGVRAFLTENGFEASGLDSNMLRKRVRG